VPPEDVTRASKWASYGIVTFSLVKAYVDVAKDLGSMWILMLFRILFRSFTLKLFGRVNLFRNGAFRTTKYETAREPPPVAEFLVGLFAKKRYRNSILSDLAEDFESDIASGISLDRAKRRYWAGALNSIGPQALAAVKRLGFWGLLVEAARRITG